MATRDDWPGLWPIIEEVVRRGETYCWPMDATEDQCRSWWMEKAGGSVFVAVADNGQIVGTAQLQANHPGAGSHVANAGFIVASHAGGRGWGRQLATHVIEAAAAQGFSAMQFNAVVASNAPAIHLWQSLGFEVLATIPRAFNHRTAGLVGLKVMHRFL